MSRSIAVWDRGCRHLPITQARCQVFYGDQGANGPKDGCDQGECRCVPYRPGREAYRKLTVRTNLADGRVGCVGCSEAVEDAFDDAVAACAHEGESFFGVGADTVEKPTANHAVAAV